MTVLQANDREEMGAFKLDPSGLGSSRFFGIISPRRNITIARGGRGMSRDGELLAFRRGDASVIVLDAKVAKMKELPFNFQILGSPKCAGNWKPIPLVSQNGQHILVVGNLQCVMLQRDGTESWRRNFCPKYSPNDRGILAADVLQDGSAVFRKWESIVSTKIDGSIDWERPVGEPQYFWRIPISAHAGTGFIATSELKNTKVFDREGNTVFSTSSPGQPVELAFDESGIYLLELSATAYRDALNNFSWEWWARVLSVVEKREVWRADDLSHPSEPQRWGETRGGEMFMAMGITSGVLLAASGNLAIVCEKPYGPRILHKNKTVARGEGGVVIGGSWQPHETVLHGATSFSITPDQTSVVVGKKNGTVLLWTPEGVKSTWTCFNTPVLNAVISPQQYLFAISHDQEGDQILTYSALKSV